MRIDSAGTEIGYNQGKQTTSRFNDDESNSMTLDKTNKKESITEELAMMRKETEGPDNSTSGEGINTEKDVIHAIEEANKHIRTYDRRLEFSIHEKTKQIMVKVINTEDDSVIREIPSEKVLDMVGHMWEVAGLLVDEKR